LVIETLTTAGITSLSIGARLGVPPPSSADGMSARAGAGATVVKEITAAVVANAATAEAARVFNKEDRDMESFYEVRFCCRTATVALMTVAAASSSTASTPAARA